jgi:hypothetical protein
MPGAHVALADASHTAEVFAKLQPLHRQARISTWLERQA